MPRPSSGAPPPTGRRSSSSPSGIRSGWSSGPSSNDRSRPRRPASAGSASVAATGSSPSSRTSPRRVVALLACASIGAIWASCSPDFGTRSLLDRFAQVSPKVLIAVDGYTYGGKRFDRRDVVEAIRAELPSLERTVLLP